MPIHGAYAEFICLPQRELVPVPPGLDAAEAVSLVLNYITAYQMLHRSAKVRSGQRVLIHGAAGGVGTALLQLGRLAGLEMYGTCSSRRASAVSDLGGIPIDYQHQDFVKEIHRLTSEGVDTAFDPSVVLISGIPARLFVLAGGWLAMALDPRYAGKGGLQVVRVVVNAFVEAPSSGCTSPADGFSRAGNGWSLQHPDAQTAETGMVSTGFDRAVDLLQKQELKPLIARRFPLLRQDTRMSPRQGRRDRQNRTRAQRVV